jgi:multimeric flavodoxin WrbA
MHIVIIMGGYRKGATFRATERLLAEMRKLKDFSSEILWVKDLELSDCIGCHRCIEIGESHCHEALKIKDFLERMKQADGVIITSPVYNDSITSLLKRYFDFNTFLWHRPELHRQWFYGVSSGGGMFKNTFKDMEKNVKAWGGTWVGALGVPHYESLTEKYQKRADRDLLKAAVQLTSPIHIKPLTMGKLLWFKMWKMNAGAAKETLKKDWAYYQGKQYYFDTSIPKWMDVIAQNAIDLMRIMMRSVYRGY